MKNKIIIIGAGLAGLALAQGLVKVGFSVTVFERDESPTSRAQGYRISIRSLGIAALGALLTPEQISRLSLAKIANVGDGFICANEKMEPFFTVPQGQDAAVQFLRSELRSLLQEGIDVQWNKRLSSLEEKDSQVIAHFADGATASGDLLVGCDGGASTVRKLLPSLYGDRLGSIPEVTDSRRAILGGQITRTSQWDELLPLNKTGFVRFVGDSSHHIGVCFSERADRSPTVFWAFSEEIKDREAPWVKFDQEGEYQRQIANHLKELIKDEPWHENLKKLIYDTPEEEIMAPWIIREAQFSEPDRLPMVPTGKITLLGDAVHSMVPDRGLGGNHALEDARVLSTLLASSPKPINWQGLIESFEKEMFARAKIAVQESNHALQYFRSLRAHSSLG